MTPQNVFNFVLVCLGMVFSGASFSITTPIYPSEALERNVSVSQSGIVIGSAYFTSVIFTPLTGKLIGLTSAKSVFVYGSLVCGLGNLGFGFVSYIEDGGVYFWISLLFRIIAAVGESVVTPTAYPLGAQQFSEKNQGKAISVVECCFGIGMVFGPSLGGVMYNAFGFSAPIWFLAALLLLIFGTSVIFLEKKIQTQLNTKEETQWKDLILCPGLISNIIGLIIAGTAYNWYSASLEPYLIQQFGFNAGQVGLILVGFSCAYTFLAPPFGVLFDWGLSPLYAALMGNGVIMLAMFLLGPIPGLDGLNNIPVKATALVLHGAGTSCTYLAALLGMVESTKVGGLPQTEQTTGMVTSVWLMSLSLGAFLGSLIGGYLYDIIGFSWLCSVEGIAVGLATLCLVGAALLGRKTDDKYQSFE